MPSFARLQRAKQISIILIALIALPMLAHMIGKMPSESEIAEQRVERSCDNLRSERLRLASLAKRCDTDADCFHYPCSCDALGRGRESTMLMSIDEALYRGCGVPKSFPYCGKTTPVCVKSECEVRPTDPAT